MIMVVEARLWMLGLQLPWGPRNSLAARFEESARTGASQGRTTAPGYMVEHKRYRTKDWFTLWRVPWPPWLPYSAFEPPSAPFSSPLDPEASRYQASLLTHRDLSQALLPSIC
jgi:hypothetical protein